MGHMTGKDLYRQLGSRLDQAPMRTPWTPILRELLEALYSPAEAELVCRLPFRPSTLARIARLSGENEPQLHVMLERLCAKGLVLDIWNGREYQYMVSPIVIGFFEFTMMRTGPDLPMVRWAELFQRYMFSEKDFLAANFGDGQQVSVMRALPHEEALGEHVEILAYEQAAALIEEQSDFSLGLCSCRHEKHHLGHAPCRTPMTTCTSMGAGARFLIRNGFARPMEKQEMRDILARSRDQGLTLSTDNVRRDAGFICHCCGCCCNLLRGVRETGYPGILVTSGFVATVTAALCTGCGLCAKACPIAAVRIEPESSTDKTASVSKMARVGSICLGCGVCALQCPTGALQLQPRARKVLHPEDSFERVLLQSLERGTLQSLLFDNPNSRTQGFMRGLVGGFLRLPPVKQALLSDVLRSRFLAVLRRATQ
jgi:Na+-translocating ferredoxin:NAD+ oxidoreductase RNF subunit RnfB